jgi:acetoin utilization deacetylase AcuC-like enzyme
LFVFQTRAGVFYSDPEVLVVSLHADPDTEYPFNAGFADQTGSGAGTGSTLNIPLPKGICWPQYREHLQVSKKKKQTNKKKKI